jgi:5-methylcytosine-specific restriction endonuclease McrA
MGGNLCFASRGSSVRVRSGPPLTYQDPSAFLDEWARTPEKPLPDTSRSGLAFPGTVPKSVGDRRGKKSPEKRSYAERREYLRGYQNTWAKGRRLAWVKANGPCKVCGSSKNLEVDHVDPAAKASHRVWTWSAERRAKELRKCQVLCRACHRRKTAAFNARIKVAKPGPRRKLTDEQVLEIFRRAKGSETAREIARDYDINHSTVVSIKNGQSYGWLTQPRTEPEQLELGSTPC